MNDKFENQNDNFEYENDNTELETEFSEEETSTFNEPLNEENFIDDDAVLEDELFGERTPQIITIPPTVEQTNTDKKGIRIFCFVLTLIILLSSFSYFGYYIGKNSKNTGNYKDTELNLESKPSNVSQSTLEKIYSEQADGVVGILVYNREGETGQASGVVYTEDGYIITNDHIYSSVPSARFKIFDNKGNEYNAVYVAGDTRSDLAVLKITDKVKLNPVVFGNSNEVQFGESVCAIGYPNGYNAKATITSGVVSVPKVRQSITSSYSCNFIQTDTPINPGNSGGALFNMYGQVIGITSSKIASTSYEGIGYAIPSVTVKKIVHSLIANGSVTNRARLGISYSFYSSAMAEIEDLPSCGLLIAEVSIDSDLNGRLKENDMITKVNDIKITDDTIILDIIEQANPGDKITLTVITQEGKEISLEAKLLSDEGSSSYTDKKPDLNDTSSQNNNGIFDFPEGY